MRFRSYFCIIVGESSYW